MLKLKEEKNKIEEKESKDIPKKSSKKKVVIIAIIIILLILAICSTVFGLANMNSDKIAQGISIGNVDVSGKTKAEAKALLKQKTETKKTEDLKIKTNVKTEEDKDFSGNISFEQLKLDYNIDESIEKAFQIGRDSNVVVNNFNVLKTFFQKNNSDIVYNYDQEELENQIESINGKIPGAVKESSYYVDKDEKELVITRGEKGIRINPDIVKEEVENEIKNVDTSEKEIDLSTEEKEPEPIDLDKVYSEVHTEPKDAYYTKDPFTLYPHVDGIDFDISMEEAKKLLEENKEEYVIPLKITKPDITTDEIGSEGFPDLLGTYKTYYNSSNKDRTTNLRLASNKIDGTVLMPGETFSYNKVVGERTIAAGYKEAPIYAGGKVVDGIGGGICQVSSTLYNAVIFANLDIVSRTNHRFVPSYVTAGRDATVVYGSIDFKFKNTRKYPIKIESSVSGGVAKVSIYGMKEEKEYDVKIETKITGSIPTKTVYEEDSTLAAGKEKVVQKGHKGTYSEAYKVVYYNGKVVSRTLLSKDKYSAMETIIKKGTKNKKEENKDTNKDKEENKKPTKPSTDNKDDEKEDNKKPADNKPSEGEEPTKNEVKTEEPKA